MKSSIQWKKRIAGTYRAELNQEVRVESRIYHFTWFAIYVLASLITIYLITQSLLKYMKCQVNTTVRRKSVTHFDFPKVTFCNRNPLGSDYFLDFLNKTNTTLKDRRTYYLLLKFESYMKNTSGRYLSLAEKQNMSDLDGMIISCLFKNKPCSLKGDFISIFDSYYLNCIRFNSGIDSSTGRPIRSKRVSSASDELSIEFYLGLPNQITTFYRNKCILVWIHEFSSNLIRLPDNEFKFTAGFDVDLQATSYIYKQFNQWPFGYSECTVGEANTLVRPLDNASIFDRLRAENMMYSRESCLNICFQQLLAKRCGCIDFWPNVTIAGYDYCLDAAADCSYDFFFNVFATHDFVTRNCLDQCPAECVTRGIYPQLSYRRYPQGSYAEKMLKTSHMLVSKYANQTDFESNLTKSVLRVTIRYHSLAYKEIVEEARMSWKSLLGELGGYLHIFLGISLISFIDIFQFIGLFLSESFCSSTYL